MKKTILFVYGTLQVGQRNNWRMFGSEHLGRARTDQPMGLYHMANGNFPGMTEYDYNAIVRAGPVWGDLFLCDSGTIKINDRFEVLYTRRPLVVVLDGRFIQAQTYFMDYPYYLLGTPITNQWPTKTHSR